MTGPDGPEGAAADGAVHPRDDDDVPVRLSASWQQAEAALYPAVISHPELYPRVLAIVRLTVDRLRSLGPSTGALLAAAERSPELVAEVLADNGLPASDLDLVVVERAALAMRHREVTVDQADRRRLSLVAQAGRAGRDWVVVEESGARDGDLFVPYSRLDVEVATGRALLVTARADEQFRAVVHAVEQLRVDLGTGAVGPPLQGAPARTTHPSAESREDRVSALASSR